MLLGEMHGWEEENQHSSVCDESGEVRGGVYARAKSEHGRTEREREEEENEEEKDDDDHGGKEGRDGRERTGEKEENEEEEEEEEERRRRREVTARDVRDVKGWKTTRRKTDREKEKEIKEREREIAFDFSPQSSMPLKKNASDDAVVFVARFTPLFIASSGQNVSIFFIKIHRFPRALSRHQKRRRRRRRRWANLLSSRPLSARWRSARVPARSISRKATSTPRCLKAGRCARAALDYSITCRIFSNLID